MATEHWACTPDLHRPVSSLKKTSIVTKLRSPSCRVSLQCAWKKALRLPAEVLDSDYQTASESHWPPENKIANTEHTYCSATANAMKEPCGKRLWPPLTSVLQASPQ